MGKKAELQAEAESLGLEFTSKTTVAELEALVADASAAEWERPNPDERCRVCRKPLDHVHG